MRGRFSRGAWGALRVWRSIVVLGAVLLCGTMPARAQECERWQPVVPRTGADGIIADAMIFDSDGPGPQPERVLVCGNFQTVGDVYSPYLAYWNGERFEPWDGPSTQQVSFISATAQREGELYVLREWGGVYRVVDRQWSLYCSTPVGVQLGGVRMRWFRGELYLVLRNTPALLRFRGNAWETVGTSSGGDRVHSVIEKDGYLYLAGRFADMGGIQADGLARFDGTNWSSPGTSSTSASGTSSVSSLVEFRGDLYAFGDLAWGSSRQHSSAARLDGTTWRRVESATPAALTFAGVVDQQLLAYALVQPLAGFPELSERATVRLGALGWEILERSPRSLPRLTTDTSNAVVQPLTFLGKLLVFSNVDQSTMTVLNSSGMNERVGIDYGARRAVGWNGGLAVLSSDGRLFFSPDRGRGPWREIPIVLPGYTSQYRGAIDLIEWNGNLVVCGSENAQGFDGLYCVVQYDGTSWSRVGEQSPSNGLGTQLFVHRGHLHVAGQFGVVGHAASLAEFDGMSWREGADYDSGLNTPMFTFDRLFLSPATATGQNLRWYSDGNRLYVGGPLQSAAGIPVRGCAMYDGQAWHALSDGLRQYDYPFSFAKVGNTVYAGGEYFGVYALQRNSWVPFLMNQSSSATLVGSHMSRLLTAEASGYVPASSSYGEKNSFDEVYGETYSCGSATTSEISHVLRLASGPPRLRFPTYPSVVRRFVGQSFSLNRPIWEERPCDCETFEHDGTLLALGVQMAGSTLRWTAWSNALELADLSLADAGEYRVLVRPSCATPVRSDSVRLQVFCLADANRSGSVDQQDIFDYLNDWFAGRWSSDGPVTAPPTTQELFRFLAAWFGGR